jgi:YrbI family 3-deoxy-D-manno-octulosonate 8-phosphate phosphatase
MDVDGTLTDAKVYYSKNGEELKKFSIRDGMGIELLKKAGILSAIITSENSQIVIARANKLKIEHFTLGSRNKKNDLILMSEKLNVSLEEIAYIGDDVNDLQALKIAGLSACPADSVSSIIGVSHYVCKQNGGDGAVRELIELILLNQEKSILLPENW